MNLHHLAVFHAIAETGSITASAQRLHISQPALSRELKVFEDRLGVTLFERHPKGMRLTQAGEVLRDYASRLFALEHAAEAAMRDFASSRGGRLTIGASNTIGTYVLPRMLAAFRREYPGVDVSLFVGNTEQVSRGVMDMRFILGFIEGPLHEEGLRATTFQDDELIPVVAADHALAGKKRLSNADIAEQTLLMREPGSGTRELVAEMLQAQGIDCKSTMEFGNTEALKQAAIHGAGIAWLPRISMSGDVADSLLHELPAPRFRVLRPLKILLRDRAYLEPQMQTFLKLIHPSLLTRLV